MKGLIVGLGNPGSQYANTRHNVAWLAMDQFSFASKLNWRDKFKGYFAQYDDFIFLKPQTYMNLSGESVVAAMQFFKIPLAQTLVIHDELDLPFGTVAFKKGGGSAGHNGLKSISALCGGPDYERFRVGIGKPPHGDVSNWVLSPFAGDDGIALEDYLKESAKALELYMKQGYDKAASKYSRKALINQF